ncbi:MAG: FtsX-like permease family protein [Rubrivivax sp.]
MSCEVIGVLASKGQAAMGMDQDDVVVLPIATMHRRITGNVNVGTLLVSMTDGADAERVNTSTLLRERRKLAEGEENNFNVLDTAQLAQALSGTTAVMTMLLGAVAAVSLLVGGIGIMNIMLVSVTERTREIGTRLAIGALGHEVLLQFLIEAVVPAALGGLVGVALATVASLVLTQAMKVPFPRRRHQPRELRLRGADRRRLRLLPGAARSAARPDRGAAPRMRRERG